MGRQYMAMQRDAGIAAGTRPAAGLGTGAYSNGAASAVCKRPQLLMAVLLAGLACLTACCLLLASPASASAADIEISSAQQLADVAAAINKGDTSQYPANGSYVLTANLDLASYSNWTPIGKAASYNTPGSNCFNGTFDGRGYTISNLALDVTTVTTSGTSNTAFAGLFGALGTAAVVHDVNLDGVTITGEVNTAKVDYAVGSLVGRMFQGVIYNCNVMNATIRTTGPATVYGNLSATGGLVGDFYSKSNTDNATIVNCAVQAEVYDGRDTTAFTPGNSTGAMQVYTGGILGRCRVQSSNGNKPVQVTNCSFAGSVAGNGWVAPIIAGSRIDGAGDLNTSTFTSISVGSWFENCFFSGSLTKSDGVNAPDTRFNLTQTDGVTTYAYDSLGNYNPTRIDSAFKMDVTRFVAQASGQGDISAIEATAKLQEWVDSNAAADYLSWRTAYKDANTQLPLLNIQKLAIVADNQGKPADGYFHLASASSGLYAYENTATACKWATDPQNVPMDEKNASHVAVALSDGQVTVIATQGNEQATYVIAPAAVSFSVAKTVNSGKVSQLEAVLSGNAAGRVDANCFTYQWQRRANESDQWQTIDGATKATLDVTKYKKGTYFQVTATLAANADLERTAQARNSGVTVYVAYEAYENAGSTVQGSDTNDGYTSDKPVKTLARAYQQLDSSATSADENHIVIMTPYTSNETWGQGDYLGDATDDSKRTLNVPATFTSVDPTYGTDYRADGTNYDTNIWQQGAYLYLFNTNDTGLGASYKTALSKSLFADTAFDNIVLAGSGSSIAYLYCQGYNLTMGESVIMKGYATAGVGTYGLSDGTQSPSFHIVAGFYNPCPTNKTGLDAKNADDSDRFPNNPTITIKSGMYARIIAGSRTATTSDNHNIFGSEKRYFKPTLDVDIQNSTKTSSYNCDIGMLCGGQTDSTMYASSQVNVAAGTIAMLLGGSIGFDRDYGLEYGNDFIGLLKVNVSGGTIKTFYGSSLGRYNNASPGIGTQYTKAYTRFLSSDAIRTAEGRTDSDPDIDVSISGGTINSNVYTAGAGGASGTDDGNTVNAQLSITGGTIKGDVFGGGYGATNGVAADKWRYLPPDAGALYGSTAVTISGATINGSVYGGGSGTSKYLAASSGQRDALAQITGNVSLSISSSTIGGSVYGGGLGIIDGSANAYDCTDMAKINGNVTLTVDDSSIGGPVFGGSAFGLVQGSASTTIQDSDTTTPNTIAGNVYGGGQGQLLAGSALTLEHQEKVGAVNGAVTLSIENYKIDGSVYGGGAVGMVRGTDGVSTTLANCTVGGSAYGGGEGAVLDDFSGSDATAMQLLLGQVAGSATLAVEKTEVTGDVYGGGSKGAVLGSAYTTLKNGATVTGSVFGAGEGRRLDLTSLEDINATQKIVGWVKGFASLVLDASQVEGSAYGGGNLGVVGDGQLTTTSPSYIMTEASGTVVQVYNEAAIGASLFGGGAGNADLGGESPRMLGAVFGTSEVTMHQGSIGADVFGGGDQSYTYAPLEGTNPQQATKVVLNAGTSIYVQADGAVAPEGEGTLIDQADDTERAINLNGSVFGAGNIADPNSFRAVTNTVYGDTSVYLKGAKLQFLNTEKGGVYGDGNLSTATGTRQVTLIDLKNQPANGASTRKTFFSLQRANTAIIHNCDIDLKGARDLTVSGDTTTYSVNRVDALRVYQGSTVQLDTVVNGLGALWSDTLYERTFTQAVTAHGDNVTDDEKASIRAFVAGTATSWTDKDNKQHDTINNLIVNNGKWLDVKQASGTSDVQPYGLVTGLFTLSTSTSDDGGAFVYAQNSPTDSTGTFVSLNMKDSAPLELYTKGSCKDVDGKICRIWYIEADAFSFERTIKASTEGSSDPILVYLPVKQTGTASLKLKDGSTVTAEASLKGLKATTEQEDSYALTMKLGEATALSDNSLNLYEGQAASGWSYDYADYAKQASDLVPVTFSLSFGDLSQNFDAQTGTVTFALVTDDGRTYDFTIHIEIQPVYAVATELVHCNSVYETIGAEDTTPITPSSSYTTEFITMYAPGAYRGGLITTLTTTLTDATHGTAAESKFPRGTRITLVDLTTSNTPKFYSYECDVEKTAIKLTDFTSLSSNSNYQQPTGNTVITENLLAIVDYSNVSGGLTPGSTSLALNHTRNNKANLTDILCWTRTFADGSTESSHNNLWNHYEISDVTDEGYLIVSDMSKVEVGHTENFMYDTYTTTLSIDTASDVTSTAYSENQVGLSLNLTRQAGQAKDQGTLPLGSQVQVTPSNGEEVARFYYDANTKKGYYLANLGSNPNGKYTITLRVQRYLEKGTLYDAFGEKPTGNGNKVFNLNVSLYRSSDGRYFSADGVDESLWSNSTQFNVARDAKDSAPVYELDINDTSTLLTASNKKVTGTFSCTNATDSDVLVTVMRRPADLTSGFVDITKAETGSVKPDAPGKFTVTDNPQPGTYIYQIRVGNTAYLTTVTVS